MYRQPRGSAPRAGAGEGARAAGWRAPGAPPAMSASQMLKVTVVEGADLLVDRKSGLAKEHAAISALSQLQDAARATRQPDRHATCGAMTVTTRCIILVAALALGSAFLAPPQRRSAIGRPATSLDARKKRKQLVGLDGKVVVVDLCL